MNSIGDAVEPSPKYSVLPLVVRKESVELFTSSLGPSFAELKIRDFFQTVLWKFCLAGQWNVL